jgi:hypothetical protein
VNLMRAHAFLAGANEIDRLQSLVQQDMAGLENGPDAHGELLTAIRAFAKTDAGFSKIIVLTADRTAVRANRTSRPQNAFQMGESGGLIVKVGIGQDGNC